MHFVVDLLTFCHYYQSVSNEKRAETKMARATAKKRKVRKTSSIGGAWISVDGTPYAIYDDGRVVDWYSNLVPAAVAQHVHQEYARRLADFQTEAA